ncbi:SRPBCC domain-containing protein [Sporosarcina sp. G11-34]|uniref:SRPBCC domain-containing protein n=1 Tax=Sporosarcina sp. G11-34 TaxID=2849605 RepID=UPI0022A8E2F5|nr:SRPBCC domain-containing protein [Sporosarcina sp. G11-34]MCZ2259551.1 SRPBCC domain-containing protein [Sporosarcina sp. G11-34]
MIAEIKQIEKGLLAHIERELNHPIENVWAMLTDNRLLKKWFEELRVGKLQKGGFMNFYIQDVMDEELKITELKMFSVLAFDWFGDEVRFEFHSKPNGCVLVFEEKINTLTEQTKKDITGWHVCLDVIQALLDGKPINRRTEWEKWYEKYTQVIDGLTGSGDK